MPRRVHNDRPGAFRPPALLNPHLNYIVFWVIVSYRIPIMSKISEEFTGNGEAKTIPIAFSGSHVTALRPPYIPSKDEQEAIPNPGIPPFTPYAITTKLIS